MMNRNEKTMNVLSLKETRDAFAKLYMKFIHNEIGRAHSELQSHARPT